MSGYNNPADSFNYMSYPSDYQRSNQQYPVLNYDSNGGGGPSSSSRYSPQQQPSSSTYQQPYPRQRSPPTQQRSQAPPTNRNARPSVPAPTGGDHPHAIRSNRNNPNHPLYQGTAKKPATGGSESDFGPQAIKVDGTGSKKHKETKGKAPSPEDPPVIRVANVPDNTTTTDIKLLFLKWGGVVKVQMWKSTRLKNTNAYVTFRDHALVTTVIAEFKPTVRLKQGIWASHYKQGFKATLNIPIGNEWFKYEAPTTLEWAHPSLPGEIPPPLPPSQLDPDGTPQSSSSALPPAGTSVINCGDDSDTPPRRSESIAQSKNGSEAASRAGLLESRKRRGSFTEEASVPPAARERSGQGGELESYTIKSPSPTLGVQGSGLVGVDATDSALIAGGGRRASVVPGPSMTIRHGSPPPLGHASWDTPRSPPPNGSSTSHGRRSLSPAGSDLGRSGRALNGQDSSRSEIENAPASSSRHQQDASISSSTSSPPTPAGGPSNYERPPASTASQGSGRQQSSPRRNYQPQQQHQRLPHLGSTNSNASSLASPASRSNPSDAPFPHPPPPFTTAPHTDADLVHRLHELESLLTASRDQSSQVYHHLLSTEASVLTLANALLSSQQAQKRIEKERDEALSWRNEVERRMVTVLGVLEKVGGRGMREGVERELDEGWRIEKEVERELSALETDVDEKSQEQGVERITSWGDVENLVRR